MESSLKMKKYMEPYTLLSESNTSFGGVNKAECHMDGIVLRPTLYLDDIKVIENGVFLI